MKDTSEFNNMMEQYYKQQKEKHSDKIDLSKSYESNLYVDDNGRHIVELIYNNKVKFKAEYELIGFYNIINSMWYWAWSIDLIDRKLAESSKKMRDFPNFIKNNMDKFNQKESEDLHFKTDMPNFFIDIDSINKLIKLTLYYLKQDWYVILCHGRNGNINTCMNNTTDTLKKEKETKLRLEYLLIKKILTVG